MSEEVSTSLNEPETGDRNALLSLTEEGDEGVKVIEEDMELLELKDGDGEGIIFHFQNMGPVSSPSSSVSKNRRYSLRPQKKPESTQCGKFKSTKKKEPLLKNRSLETIFENPVMKNGSLTLLGRTKLKRYLSLGSFVSKTKLRHRKLKLKRLANGKKKKKDICRVSIEEVKLKLKALEEEENEWIDIQL